MNSVSKLSSNLVDNLPTATVISELEQFVDLEIGVVPEREKN